MKNCKVTSVHDCRGKFRSIWTVTESSALQLFFPLAKIDNESEGNTFPNVRGKCDENYRRLNAITEVNWEEILSRTRLMLSDVGEFERNDRAWSLHVFKIMKIEKKKKILKAKRIFSISTKMRYQQRSCFRNNSRLQPNLFNLWCN